MFLPAVQAAGVDSLVTRFVVAVVAVSQIIFFLAMVPCILATDIPLKVWHLVVVWFQRVVLTILVAAPVAHVLLSPRRMPEVPARRRAVAILRHLSGANRPVGAGPLVRALDLPRSTVYDLLAVLEELALVAKTDGGYLLGAGVSELGSAYVLHPRSCAASGADLTSPAGSSPRTHRGR